MSVYEIILTDDSEPHVVSADAYQQEGPMTTFFACDRADGRLDSWATRLASFRSADIRVIRRLEPPAAGRRPVLDLVTGTDA